jgi:hypothetical protein
MAMINGVDFNQVAKEALAAAKAAANDENAWKSLKDIIKNVTDSLQGDVQLIAKRKISGEFNEDDAKVFMEDQKMVARIRIRSVAIIGLQLAERIWNAIADVFRTAINQALGWTVL